jgi:hypothetical protein
MALETKKLSLSLKYEYLANPSGVPIESFFPFKPYNYIF